jgi:hypothetical protein
MIRYFFLLLFLLSGCTDSPAERPNGNVIPDEIWFQDKAELLHNDLIWTSGDTGNFYMPEIIGGGAALFDFDNDGDLDIYFVNGGNIASSTEVGNILLENQNGAFKNITDTSNSGDTGYGMGVTTGDYDNDGYQDVYITNVGSNVLLHNDGDGTFSDVTQFATVGDEGWGASTAFVDIDSDGDLDLFVVNYLMWEHGLKLDCYNAKGSKDYCSPTNYMAPARDTLYLNNGDGTFTDISLPAGFSTQTGTGLGVLCNDYTGDGLIDIFVANDGMADQLWMNNGDLTFTDVAPIRGCALDEEGKAKAGMGVTTEDFDNDGDFDILVCNLFGESDSLYRNDGEFFTDVTAQHGIRTSTRHATRFGLGLVDFNNDGHLDIYEANGRVSQIGDASTSDPFAEPNHFLIGDSKSWQPITVVDKAKVHTSRAAVFGDINNDGGIDILVVNKDAPAYLLMNVHPDKSNSVLLDVRNKFDSPALGAFVTANRNGTIITKPVQSAWSYMASNDPRVHIGLGNATSLQDVTVHWVDGTTTSFGELEQGLHALDYN